jgi:hypothetical protein
MAAGVSKGVVAVICPSKCWTKAQSIIPWQNYFESSKKIALWKNSPAANPEVLAPNPITSRLAAYYKSNLIAPPGQDVLISCACASIPSSTHEQLFCSVVKRHSAHAESSWKISRTIFVV